MTDSSNFNDRLREGWNEPGSVSAICFSNMTSWSMSQWVSVTRMLMLTAFSATALSSLQLFRHSSSGSSSRNPVKCWNLHLSADKRRICSIGNYSFLVRTNTGEYLCLCLLSSWYSFILNHCRMNAILDCVSSHLWMMWRWRAKHLFWRPELGCQMLWAEWIQNIRTWF